MADFFEQNMMSYFDPVLRTNFIRTLWGITKLDLLTQALVKKLEDSFN